jgi:hypothetical protein
MTSQTIRFEKMNSDIDPKFLPEGNYISAVNCRPNNLNAGAGFVLENIPSTLAVTPPSFGQAVTRIGGCNDYKRTSIIAFYRGSTRQFITSLNVNTQTETIILISSVLDFSQQITHAGVLDDDLFFIDGANKLRKVNIALASANATLDYFSSGDLLVDKFPPLLPPTCVADEDTSFDGNNITNSIFQFCYAWQYAGKELSSWSPLSKSVLPESSDDHTFNNNRITVTLETGNKFVEKIYIAYRIGESGEVKVTEILDKTKLSIADDATYNYEFYNQKFVEPVEKTSVLANTNNPFYEFGTMAISKDNFLIAGWVKDGLTKPTDISLSVAYDVQSTNTRHATYKTGSTHGFGVVFRDENGRTDGVNAVTDVAIPFLTSSINSMRAEVISASALSGFFPYVEMDYTLTGTVPTWAKTLSFVYVGNKSLSSFVQYTLSGIDDAGDFTYLDISRLNSINSTISVLEPVSQNTNISAYTFTKGDRIRFIREEGGSLLNGQYDYEILGYVPEVTDSSGNILYQNTIYVNKFDWDAANIGKNSLFEIYSPKKEYADNVYYEIGEVIEVTGGAPLNLTGTLSDGDSYVFERTMNIFDLGEFISDKDFTIDYNGPFTTSVYYRPSLNIIKLVDGASATLVGQFTNPTSAYFYRNTTGSTVSVDVSGKYDITFETDGGVIFALDATNSGGGNIFNKEFFSVSGLSGVQRITKNGNINETVSLPNNAGIYFSFRAVHKLKIDTPVVLDFSIKIRTGSGELIEFVESKNYSDYYSSDEHSFGRVYTEIEQDIDKKNNIVYSGRYFADTDINETNKFNAVDVRYVPYEFGYINLMRVKGDTLKVFTPNKEMSFYLGREQYASGEGTSQFVLTSNLISQQPRVYDSDYGTENPESCLSVGNDIYYYDRKNAAVVRTSDNGQLNIGDYGYSAELRRITKLFTAAGSKNVYIGYNDKNYEVIVCFVIDGAATTVVFKESDNTWSHTLEMQNSSAVPIEGMINYGENMVAYLSGSGYLWEQGATYNTFFGDTKSPVIRFVCNQNHINTKVFKTLSYQGEGQWNIQVETEKDNIHPYGQYTQMLIGRQKIKEGIYFVDITPNLKDKNNVISSLRYAKGQPMRGRYATITMTNEDTTRVLLDEVTVGYIDSPVQ